MAAIDPIASNSIDLVPTLLDEIESSLNGIQSDPNSIDNFASMIELIYGSSSAPILTDAQKQSAYKSFVDTTGFTIPNYIAVFNALSDATKTTIAYNAFYFFLPMLLLCYIGIIAMAIYGWINWAVMLFLLGIATIILYGASIGYRYMAQQWILKHQTSIVSSITSEQEAYKNSIALWPHGLLAVADNIIHGSK